jgi:hypothetical protein
MKTNKLLKLLTISLTLGLWAAQAAWAFGPKKAEEVQPKPRDMSRVQTDVNAVFNVGSGSATSEKVALTPGLYLVDEFENQWDPKYYMLVNDYVNDTNKKLVILFPKNALYQGGTTRAKLFQARPIKNGTSIMLSPLAIDNEGNIRIVSEGREDAPVVEIAARNGGFNYPFMLKPRNGALNGRLHGMRKVGGYPQLLPRPTTGVFSSGNRDRTNATIDGDEISIFGGSLRDQTFSMFNLNGDLGNFSALTRSSLNTMREVSTANEKIELLAAFISGCWSQETFVTLRPQVGTYGDFEMEFFHLGNPTLLEKLFGPGPSLGNSSQNVDYSNGGPNANFN